MPSLDTSASAKPLRTSSALAPLLGVRLGLDTPGAPILETTYIVPSSQPGVPSRTPDEFDQPSTGFPLTPQAAADFVDGVRR